MMMTHDWTEQQDAGRLQVRDWYDDFKNSRNPVERRNKQIFRLFGYAGTGKSTMASDFEDHVHGEVVYGAFTGKASMVMRSKGCHGASTLHSLVYRTKVNQETGAVSYSWNPDSPIAQSSLVIVDECSMVNQNLGMDILRFGKPILVLGDPGQLPPVEGAGFFTNSDPDVMLTEIHRQAKGNPVIALASMARKNKEIPYGNFGGVVITDRYDEEEILGFDQVITGTNKTRIATNMAARRLLEKNTDLPTVGEKIICTKNDRDTGVFNGITYDVVEVIPFKGIGFRMVLQEPGAPNRIAVKALKSDFSKAYKEPEDWRVLRGYQRFDFAYAITCHKSQGSQYQSLLLKDESWVFGEHQNRWLYTAITRCATERLKIVRN